jgi:hypothetical protein
VHIKKIISGGQSGVDRAALDVALEMGMAVGGWCPKGRKAEDGRIADKYPLQETVQEDYETRTRQNVRDSDATLILFRKNYDEGTQLTEQTAEQMQKPVLSVDLELNEEDNLEKAVSWLKEQCPEVLNVAGPRESNSPGIYLAAYGFLKKALL